MFVAVLALTLVSHPQASRPLAAVPFERVTVRDPFFAPRIATNRRVTVPTCLARCEETGRLKNFDVASGKVEGKPDDQHRGERYDDSDVYKVLEGIAYALRSAPDAALEARADAIIDSIAAAQRADGYLNTYYQVVAPEKRWSDIRHGHELYCGGHLIEAGVAYAQATGKTKLLEVAKRFADLVAREFGPEKRLDPCGHAEIELALVKLARATGEKRYLELAQFFVEQRGHPEGRAALFGEYAQDHKPVREQTEAVGHAVRAMYLYSAMADVAADTGDATLLAPLEALWKDVVERKMYVTGGIGSSADNEGFTKAFDLPNDRAYCETCASVGMALWSQRMLLATRDAQYADLVELQSYNVIPAAVSLSGDRFFYGNPMQSDGKRQREPWFRTACCPTNLVRYLPAMGERIYATDGRDLYVSQFVASEADVELAGTKVHVSIDTQYPWDGKVEIRFAFEGHGDFHVRARWPAWCSSVGVRRGDGSSSRRCRGTLAPPRAHWIELDGPWKSGERVSLSFYMPPRTITGRESVDAERGRVAFARGPIIYAFEGAELAALRDAIDPKLFDVPRLLPAWRADWRRGAAAMRAMFVRTTRGEEIGIDTVPYCVWGDGEPSPMTVWFSASAR